MENKLTKTNLKELEKAFNGDLDLVLFFLSWIKNGRNASKAYLELNPHVDPHSARVLGSRQLAKVNRQAILEAYGIGVEKYFEQLRDGLDAIKSDATGQTYPDHKVRKEYHKTLGQLLGIETDQPQQTNIQVNIHPEFLKKYGKDNL